MPVSAPDAVAAVFQSFAPPLRRRVLALRRLIFDTAAATPGVGDVTETLKWGEPAYLTEASGSGSTIRIGRTKRAADCYAVYFNCRTDLVDRFRAQFGDTLCFDGNRAIVLKVEEELPTDALAVCIAAALTYHRDRRAKRSRS